jgi:hypothetical protein
MPYLDHPNRLHNATVASLKGRIYEEAKDQHGCRFLQRKLEERDANDIQMIFDEAKLHVVDLMMGMSLNISPHLIIY